MRSVIRIYLISTSFPGTIVKTMKCWQNHGCSYAFARFSSTNSKTLIALGFRGVHFHQRKGPSSMSITRRLFAICIGLAILSLIVVGLEIRTTAAAAGSQQSSLVGVGAPSSARKSASFARPSPPRRLGQASQGEKTIGETKKNIQALKEFPKSQLIPMMNLMAASLGVKCNFCHVNNAGQWDYPSDDKPEEKTAREIVTITLSVNKTTFNGRTEVSCFTCHGGRTNPVRDPILP